MADLTSALLEFCSLLRDRHGFDVGHDEARLALAAVKTVGIGDRDRVRYALRSVCCSSATQLTPFDRVFDAFFTSDEPGIPQPRPRQPHAGEEHPDAGSGRNERRLNETPASADRVMQARYSPIESAGKTAAAVSEAGLAETLSDVSRLISALHLGRSRKWKAHVRGPRLDIRGTLRSSLQTGGDPVRLRTLGHPRRNPRIVLLIDASRSMSEHAGRMLQLGYALSRRSQRAGVFVFSTALREVTRDLRRARAGDALEDFDATTWGGGTRIGTALREFSRRYATRIDTDTLVVIGSDGLDVDDTDSVRDAMRDLYRRSAGIIWINPHAGRPGFEPATRAMQAALPYLSALLDANDAGSLIAAARRLRR